MQVYLPLNWKCCKEFLVIANQACQVGSVCLSSLRRNVSTMLSLALWRCHYNLNYDVKAVLEEEEDYVES